MKQKNHNPINSTKKRPRVFDHQKRPNYRKDQSKLKVKKDFNMSNDAFADPTDSSNIIDEDDWQPKGHDAHLSKLGGPMRKSNSTRKKPNPLNTSWGSAVNDNLNSLSAPQRPSNNAKKTKKSRSFRSKVMKSKVSPHNS